MPNSDKEKEVKSPEIEILDDPNLTRAYSNYVSVTTAPNECNLTFCLIEPPKTSSKVVAKVVSKVMIPNSLVKEILKVIESNYDNVMKKLEEMKK